VFCDKPLAMTTAEARRVQAVVDETGTRFMSASSLRYVPDIVQLRHEIASGAFGQVPIVCTACGNDLVYYGIHALSMYLGVFPHDQAVSCINVGQPGRNIVRVRFASGRDLVLVVGEQPYMSPGWQITVYGEKSWRLLQPDLTNLYGYLLQAFVDYVQQDQITVPVAEEVAVIATLEAGQRSLAEGREVAVAELLEEAEPR
jgi:predicted dehydrogenase